MWVLTTLQLHRTGLHIHWEVFKIHWTWQNKSQPVTPENVMEQKKGGSVEYAFVTLNQCLNTRLHSRWWIPLLSVAFGSYLKGFPSAGSHITLSLLQLIVSVMQCVLQSAHSITPSPLIPTPSLKYLANHLSFLSFTHSTSTPVHYSALSCFPSGLKIDLCYIHCIFAEINWMLHVAEVVWKWEATCFQMLYQVCFFFYSYRCKALWLSHMEYSLSYAVLRGKNEE